MHDNVWNKASEKRTSCNDVLSPDRNVKPSIVAKTGKKFDDERGNNVVDEDDNLQAYDVARCTVDSKLPGRIKRKQDGQTRPYWTRTSHQRSLLRISWTRTKIVNETNKIVVRNNHEVNFGGKRNIKSSDCPRIWLIFELADSPTPNIFRTFKRLWRSPELVFLEEKRRWDEK